MRILLSSVLILFSTVAMGQETAIIGGLNWARGDVEVGTTDIDLDPQIGFQGGVRYYHDFQGQMVWRLGATLNYSGAEATIGTSNIEFTTMHIMAPITIQYNASEQFGFFGGLGAGILIDDDCELNGQTCNNFTDFESFVLDLQFGVAARFSDFIAAEVYYQLALTDIADNTDIGIVGIQLLFLM